VIKGITALDVFRPYQPFVYLPLWHHELGWAADVQVISDEWETDFVCIWFFEDGDVDLDSAVFPLIRRSGNVKRQLDIFRWARPCQFLGTLLDCGNLLNGRKYQRACHFSPLFNLHMRGKIGFADISYLNFAVLVIRGRKS
jgi:hypothetical protein